ncbi:MAG: hypothetical protein AAB262_13990, partial [Elusimicrobiota bacterium]
MILAALVMAAVASAQESAFSELGLHVGINIGSPRQEQERWRQPDAQRRYNDVGHGAAVRSCMKASFDSEKKNCVEAANAAMFFDPAAAEACGEMSFGSAITSCLNAVANKTYLPDEIHLCRDSSFDRGKVDCFRSAGRRYEGRQRYDRRPDLDSYIIRQLRQIRT